ncbi:MAG: hypothetical protein MUC34_15250 [Anaerolineae bacterium]|nr:hypothetical protein [Anaerolineae bacterium]
MGANPPVAAAKRRSYAIASTVLLLAVVAMTACASLPAISPAASPGASTDPFELTVVHSNDTWGYLDPCG